jgi:hypothetical protein
MLGLCIIMYTFTNLQKARYLSRQTITANQKPAKESA